MNRLVAAAALTLLSCSAHSANSEVSIRIVDYPGQVLRFGPIFITAEVRNDGSTPVLIPASNFTTNRWLIETGSDVNHLSEFRALEASGGGDVAWLAPGRSYLFMKDIGPWFTNAGRLAVRVGLQSGGECQYSASGGEQFPLKPIERRPGVETYHCWKGETRSNAVTIDIQEPTSSTDIAALEFARSPDFPVACCLDNKFGYRLQMGHAALMDRFPTSHYAYAATFYGCANSADCLQGLRNMQPSNPLNPYALLREMLVAMESSHGTSPTEAQIRESGLPSALSQYLLQQKARLERGKASRGNGTGSGD